MNIEVFTGHILLSHLWGGSGVGCSVTAEENLAHKVGIKVDQPGLLDKSMIGSA